MHMVSASAAPARRSIRECRHCTYKPDAMTTASSATKGKPKREDRTARIGRAKREVMSGSVLELPIRELAQGPRIKPAMPPNIRPRNAPNAGITA
jgi:hypothetical protein